MCVSSRAFVQASSTAACADATSALEQRLHDFMYPCGWAKARPSLEGECLPSWVSEMDVASLPWDWDAVKRPPRGGLRPPPPWTAWTPGLMDNGPWAGPGKAGGSITKTLHAHPPLAAQACPHGVSHALAAPAPAPGSCPAGKTRSRPHIGLAAGASIQTSAETARIRIRVQVCQRPAPVRKYGRGVCMCILVHYDLDAALPCARGSACRRRSIFFSRFRNSAARIPSPATPKVADTCLSITSAYVRGQSKHPSQHSNLTAIRAGSVHVWSACPAGPLPPK